jgi:subtilisin family serine protease/flagellar hook assembly protein FlgD
MRQRSGARGPARLALVAALAVTAAGVPAAGAAAAERPRPRPAGAPKAVGELRQSGAAEAVAGRGRTRYAVTFAPGADAEAALAVARAHGGQVKQRIPQLRVVSVEVPLHAAGAVAAALARRPGVEAVTPVRIRTPHHTPDDPEYATAQPYLATVNAPAAWDVTKGAADVLIAVVDSGVDVTHPDLAGKVAGTWDVVTGTADVTDLTGHGTFVAGVAAAATDNATGVAGAGFDSGLLAVKAADSTGAVFTDAEAAGIVWAADHGADVINVSGGSAALDPVEQQAVHYALGKGVAIVASAGNAGTTTPTYPAAYPGVLSVGATDGDARAASSNHGSWVDVGAPGTGIRSTVPGGGYETRTGTSYAAPLVAGEVALLRALNPAATPEMLNSAVFQGTTSNGTAAGTGTVEDYGYGFGWGRVDFAAAIDYLPPASKPAITAPASGATVSGDVVVSATSDQPRVEFDIDNGSPSVVAVSQGVASSTLETYGLSGTQYVKASDCAAHACAHVFSIVPVTVDNGVPTITSPAPSSLVNTTQFTATATTPDNGGGVAFHVDGDRVAFDGEAPFSVPIETFGRTEGTHQLTAVRCNRAGSICDRDHPSATVPFVVHALHPVITSITPNPFSPNKDGRYEKATVKFTLETAQHVVLQVSDFRGTVVRGPGSLGTLPAGQHTWVWDGRRKDGTVAPDVTYTVALLTTKPSANGTLAGLALKTVRVDTVAPVLSSLTGAGRTFYPHKDGYRDTFNPSVKIAEPGRLLLRVYNSHGTRVRTLDAGWVVVGEHHVTWNGRRADGSMLPAGTYKFEFVAHDKAGNYRLTSRYAVYLSAKRLEARTATRTVSPDATRYDAYVGDCSRGTTPAIYGEWAGSIGYYSDYYECSSADLDDFVATFHRLALPSAIKYGTVRIGATSREAIAGFGDTAALVYQNAASDPLDHGATLGSAYATRWGDSVPVSRLAGTGRTVRWFTGTVGDSWYEVRSFHVKWVYYVLV